MLRYLFTSLFVLILSSAYAQIDSLSAHVPFSIDDTCLTAWNGEQYVPFFTKGVNLGVSVPGTFPGQLAATYDDYYRWFGYMHEAGFNHIRLYTLHFPRFYQALADYNNQHPNQPLYFMQGVWLEEELPGYTGDLYELDSAFSEEMKENVRAVHGDIQIPFRYGKAHGTFDADASKWCMAYIMGREIYPDEVFAANQNHPNKTSFNGNYLTLTSGSPAEVLLVSHLDSLIHFEWSNYQTMRPVAMSSWPTLDPLTHPTEINAGEDTAQIDLAPVDISNAPAGMFIAYHAYPYYPDFISSTPSYRTYSDEFGMNSYLGYLVDLKSHYPNMPLIIAEYGTPSSWGVAHYAASGMDHGGHTEKEQGEMGSRLMKNIQTAGCGGGSYFAWIDEWFKSTWITDVLEISPSTRVLWPNYIAAEQNFGLLGYVDTANAWQSWNHNCVGCNITDVYTKSTVGDFNIFIESVASFAYGDTLYIALDTYSDTLGERVLPNGDTLDIGAEFLLQVYDGKAELMVMRSYDLFGMWHGTSDPDQLYQSTASTSGDWRIERFKNNSSSQDIQYIGNLHVNHAYGSISSMDAVIVDTNSMHIRLPWAMLQFMDPSHKVVIHDDRATPQTENDSTEGIRLQIIENGVFYSNPNRVTWQNWNVVTQVAEVKKMSFEIFGAALPLFEDFTLSRVDAYSGVNGIYTVPSNDGVLANDEQLSGGEMTAVIIDAPSKGFLQLNPDGGFTYIPSSSWDGNDEFTYSALSLGDQSVATSVTLTGDAVIQPWEDLLDVYPVPATDVLHVVSLSSMDKVELVNAEGQIVYSAEPHTSAEDLELSSYAAGVYLLRVTQDENILVRKVIIH